MFVMMNVCWSRVDNGNLANLAAAATHQVHLHHHHDHHASKASHNVRTRNQTTIAICAQPSLSRRSTGSGRLTPYRTSAWLERRIWLTVFVEKIVQDDRIQKERPGMTTLWVYWSIPGVAKSFWISLGRVLQLR